ncbi:hypothetical protein ACFSSA_05150 [Luteolibacter algae]|uniref:Uncharacterized protein n=1 Tax=Luteolibacter algae TaxID=454151 RepID=A0ABW5D8X7_9BACT
MNIKKAIKPVLLACAIGLPLSILWKNLPEVLSAAKGANYGLVAMVLLGLVAYTIINASVWSEVLRGLGCGVSRLTATRTWIECEAMKWLPGGIWGYASRVVKAPAIGVPKAIAGASLVAELLITIMAWAVLGGVGLLLDGKILDELLIKLGGENADAGSLYWIIPVAGAAIGAALVAIKPVRSAVLKRLAPLRVHGWSALPLLRSFLAYLGLCVFHAFMLMLLVKAVFSDSVDFSFATASAADGGAWLIGFFAIGVPGGIGVREAGIAWFLANYLPLPDAIAIAVMWRALQIFAELLALGGSLLIGHLSHQEIPVSECEVAK